MPYSNGKITAPVSVYDVKRALNASANDVGRLCAHQKINKWARFKPIHAANKISPLTWLNNCSYGHGFSLITSPTEAGLLEKLKSYVRYLDGSTVAEYTGFDRDGTKYNRPSGGAASPYRLSDYACIEKDVLGYHHLAEEQYVAPKGNNTYTDPIGAVLGADTYTYTNNDGTNLPQFGTYADEWACWDGITNPESFLSGTPSATAVNLDLSVQELIRDCAEMPSQNDMYRGIVLIEPNAGVVSFSKYKYNSTDEIPWGLWRDELVSYNNGTWWRFETYALTGTFVLIPGFVKQVTFNLGTNTIAFLLLAEEDNAGEALVTTTSGSSQARFWFRCSAGNVNDWYSIRVVIRKIMSGGTYSTPYYEQNINNIPTEQSGGVLWYKVSFGVTSGIDNWTVPPTDKFQMQIFAKLYSSSTEQVVSEKTLTLTE